MCPAKSLAVFEYVVELLASLNTFIEEQTTIGYIYKPHQALKAAP